MNSDNSEEEKRKLIEVVCLFIKAKEELCGSGGSITKYIEYLNNAKDKWKLYFPDEQLDVDEMFRCCESLYYDYTGFSVLSGKRSTWSGFFNKNK